MRTIKFRAWDNVQKNIFIVGTTYHKSSGELVRVQLMGQKYMLNVSQIKLMQYTGLKDKNGVEIYEGDIVKYKDNTMQVRWNERFALFGFSFKIGATEDLKKDCEVIGNIYQNPELIK